MYISEEKREVLDPIIQAVVAKLGELQLDDLADDSDANVEYVLARLITRLYDGSEARFALGVLSNVAQEYSRRVAGPYYVQQSYDRADLADTFEQPQMTFGTPDLDIKVGGSV